MHMSKKHAAGAAGLRHSLTPHDSLISLYLVLDNIGRLDYYFIAQKHLEIIRKV